MIYTDKFNIKWDAFTHKMIKNSINKEIKNSLEKYIIDNILEATKDSSSSFKQHLSIYLAWCDINDLNDIIKYAPIIGWSAISECIMKSFTPHAIMDISQIINPD